MNSGRLVVAKNSYIHKETGISKNSLAQLLTINFHCRKWKGSITCIITARYEIKLLLYCWICPLYLNSMVVKYQMWACVNRFVTNSWPTPWPMHIKQWRNLVLSNELIKVDYYHERFGKLTFQAFALHCLNVSKSFVVVIPPFLSCLIFKPNFHVSLSHQCSTTAFLETNFVQNLHVCSWVLT